MGRTNGRSSGTEGVRLIPEDCGIYVKPVSTTCVRQLTSQHHGQHSKSYSRKLWVKKGPNENELSLGDHLFVNSVRIPPRGYSGVCLVLDYRFSIPQMRP